MIGQLREALRRKPLVGVVVSIAVHLALVLALIGVHPARTPVQKRGDALIVELPSLAESGNAGTPGPERDATLTPAAPAPEPKAPPARPTPPAPPRPPAAARPAPERATPRETPRAVASAPQPPATAEPADTPATKPAAPSETAPPAAEIAKPAPPPTPEPPAVASAPPPGQVAVVPPAPPDFLSTFRRGGGGGGIGAGGGGGTGAGRGGILGEPIQLDSKDPDFNDYLERIRRLIKQNWLYPCVKNPETHACEFKSARLVVDFGILKHGPVQFVDLQKSSGYAIYDSYAVNAIKLASPFPPVPAALMARFPAGSAGVPIRVNFVYMLETGITNVIR